MVVFINDVIELGESASDFLLQCHEGFFHGVKDTGFISTTAAIMMSSNQGVPKR